MLLKVLNGPPHVKKIYHLLIKPPGDKPLHTYAGSQTENVICNHADAQNLPSMVELAGLFAVVTAFKN